MPNDSCIHCGQPAEDDDKFTAYGRVHRRCSDAFSDHHDNPVEVSRPMRFLGVFLRFLGMAIIIGAALSLLSSYFIGFGTYTVVGPLFIGLAGAGIHFAGRKIAPGTHWASVTGGIAGLVGFILAFIIAPLVIFALLFFAWFGSG